MQIPFNQLSSDALQGLLEEFVTREGTDYGYTLLTLEEKVAQVRQQLEGGEVVIFFDPVLQSCNLMRRDEALRRER